MSAPDAEPRPGVLSAAEEAALGRLSRERLWEHAATLAGWVKVSGTPGEREAAGYLAARLAEYGFDVRTHEVESLIGRPEAAVLEVEGPVSTSIHAITHSLAPSTTDEGVCAELVSVAADSDAAFATAAVRGRVALLDGRPTASLMMRAAEHGAAGLVCIQEDRLHELCVSPVWGTPTTRTAPLLPTVPVVSVLRADGERLRAAALGGPLRVRLVTRTFTGWVNTPLVVGEIRGAVEPERFVLLSGHHCSWYVGAMDNGSANATMLEVARVLADGPRPRRSLRVAFWPGHTQGRYSGSTWYADTFWEDLHDNCVLHVNADSTGARGAGLYKALSMPETREFALGAIRDSIGEEAVPERQSRAGDQSFWGPGVPSVFMDLSNVPLEMAARTSSGAIARRTAPAAAEGNRQGGLPWWWHTDEDTLDKVDPEVLLTDTRVYLLATLRAADAGLLPFRYAPAATEIREAVERYQALLAERFDLAPTRDRAAQVEAVPREVDVLLERARGARLADADLAAINRELAEMDHELVLLAFSAAGRFDQDLAVPLPPVPLLALSRRLAELATTSSEFRFVRTELLRNRNQLGYHLRLALAAGERARDLLSRASAR